ncbi:MAG: prepilin-type N-terminal cleavage/methylation domain-containing protein [Acidobacteriota bacterium]|nr:prepilin-type N-terminal cleavage/methylation domain-containing protein [Acidobacteriota bacterium]
MNRRRSGFTLLEVMVATVIMGIAVTGLIVGLSQAVKNASRLADYDRAVMLARTKMNDLLLDVDLPLNGAVEGRFDSAQSGGIESGWRAVLKPFEEPPNAGPGTVIVQQVALQIWWQPVSGTRRTMQLSSYRPAQIPVPVNP